MKVLLITAEEKTRSVLEASFKARGFEFIQYRNPVKAIDNLAEIEPDIVLFNAGDYPRHWKPFIGMLRAGKSREELVFILLKGSQFPEEEAAKAVHLEVNGIIDDDINNRHFIAQLENIFTRYKNLADNRKELRYITDSKDKIELVFSKNISYRLINGRVTDISLTGLNFMPDDPQATLDIKPGEKFAYCSLRIGEIIVSTALSVIRNNKTIYFRFENLPQEAKELLEGYFNSKAERALEERLKQ
jgi:DNA-binding response OmpR family regulator